MTWLIIVLIITLSSFVLQVLLSKKQGKWLGLIIPAVFFVAASIFLALNLMDAFATIKGYGLFLAEYGGAGLFAMIVKIGFVYTPVVIQLAIYLVYRHNHKKRNNPAKNNKEFKKMIVDDLN